MAAGRYNWVPGRLAVGVVCWIVLLAVLALARMLGL